MSTLRTRAQYGHHSAWYNTIFVSRPMTNDNPPGHQRVAGSHGHATERWQLVPPSESAQAIIENMAGMKTWPPLPTVEGQRKNRVTRYVRQRSPGNPALAHHHLHIRSREHVLRGLRGRFFEEVTRHGDTPGEQEQGCCATAHRPRDARGERSDRHRSDAK